MNHRQWKKDIKKKHGRNPVWTEDKRNKTKNDLSIDALSTLIQSIPDITNKIQNAFGMFFKNIGESCLAMSDALLKGEK